MNNAGLHHVVFYSGGLGSYECARRVIAEYGTESVTLLFTDTKMEDEDLYRFLDETEFHLGVHITRIADGRTPWEVFASERMLGNSQHDPCSRTLKRRLARRWVRKHRPDPSLVHLWIGMGTHEAKRLEGARSAWRPYSAHSALFWEPAVSRQEIIDSLEDVGIESPRLYEMGFSHNNCGGFCVKAGQAHFRLLLEKLPDRYAYHERQEQEFRKFLGRDVAILRDRRGGRTTPLTLKQLRTRDLDDCALADWGGCGCFA